MKEITYTVSKAKNSDLYYAHRVGYSSIPVMSERGTFGTKQNALRIAADSMGLPLKDYLKLRSKSKRK